MTGAFLRCHRLILAILIFCGSPFALAETKTLSIGLLKAHELETLTPSEQSEYIYALQLGFEEGVSGRDSSVAGSKFQKRLIEFFFGESAVAYAGSRYCIKEGGYVILNPPCRFPDYFLAGFANKCGANSIMCNPWLYGENVCAPRNGSEMQTCGANSKSGAEIARFILKSETNKRSWDIFIRDLEDHCAHGNDAALCGTISARMWAVNDALAGRPAAALGATSVRSVEAPQPSREVERRETAEAAVRAEIKEDLPATQRIAREHVGADGKISGCNPYQLLNHGTLTLSETKSLMCGGTPPTTARIDARTRAIANRVAGLGSTGRDVSLRSSLARTKDNLLKCVAAVQKTTLFSTVIGSPAYSRMRVRVCPIGNDMYRANIPQKRITKRVYKNLLARALDIGITQTVRPADPVTTRDNLGNMLAANKVDICAVQIETNSCGDHRSSGNPYLPDAPTPPTRSR